MRCTRCDQPAVPQSVGWTPCGTLVFGWCPDCMAEFDCVLVEAPPLGSRRLESALKRGAATRGILDQPPGPAPGVATPASPEVPAWIRGSHSPELILERLRFVRYLAGALGVGGAAFIVGGLLKRVWPPDAPASPFGNGTTPFLIAGGCSLLALGLTLLRVAGPPPRRPRPAPRAPGARPASPLKLRKP